MLKVNVQDAKTHLSRYLDRVEQGEVIVLCRRNVPVAEIRRLEPTATNPRPIGLDQGRFQVTDAFFEDLPDDLVDSFEGR